MKQQAAFNRVVEVHSPNISRLLTRYLFGDYPNKRKPLTSAEISELAGLGIRLHCPSAFSHADTVQLAQEQHKKADRERILSAFVLSVDDRYTMFRAPLQAWAITSTLPSHRYSAWRHPRESPCSVCGCDRRAKRDPVASAHFLVDYGTCGDDSSVIDAAWCLNWFRTVDVSALRSEQLQRFRQLLKVIDEAPAGCTSAKVASLLGPVLGGNKYSRQHFMETLGLAGILWVEHLPGLLQHWTPWTNRPQSGEMIAPAALWRRRNGFNPEVFADLFPHFKLPKGLSQPQAVG